MVFMKNNKFLSNVFLWMFIGLLVTFATGFYVSTNENILLGVFSGPWPLLLVIAEFALVIFLSARSHKMSKTAAQISFLLYAFVSGLTFSTIFVVYQMSSIVWAFLISAVLFLVLAAVGRYTKIDLTRWGTYLFIGLIAVVICSIINLFFFNETFNLIISIVSIVLFLGLTAYDVQKLVRISESVENPEALTIIGALDLYLDFINIFLDMLTIIGNTKD